MSKKTKFVVAIIVVLIIVIVAIYSNNGNSTKIKIGIVGHFSGDYASYGVPMKNAVELALSQIDPNGDKFELVAEDDASTNVKAAAAVNKLINIDKVNFVISAQSSGGASVVAPVTESNKKILMITLASAPDLLKGTNYVFRSVPSDVYQGVKMFEYIDNVLKSEKVAGLYTNDPYGLGINKIIETDLGAKNVDSEIFTPGSTDFRTNLLKIKNSGVTTIVIVAKKEFPLILKQIKELGIKADIVASETFKDDTILANSGTSADGVVTFMAQPVDHVNFASDYKNKFGVDPSAYSMYAYDGAIALMNAIKVSGDNVDKVKQVLSKTNEGGASGNVSFDQSGDRTGVDYLIFKVEGGKFVKI
jgi:branched-chain amino acid transport system substrate-binding protein